MQEYTTHNKLSSLKMADHNTAKKYPTAKIPLHRHVEQAINAYLIESEGQPVTGLYNTVLAAIEPPLLRVALKFCKTQDEAAKTLGLSRGTLRKKLKQYQVIEVP